MPDITFEEISKHLGIRKFTSIIWDELLRVFRKNFIVDFPGAAPLEATT